MYRLTLETTAYTPDQLPGSDLPGVALAGRSNVGKSSLINTLAGRKNLARISSTPGKTRSVNFYLVQPGNFYLVDLPGYGYARCSKTEREKWGLLVQKYLEAGTGLRAVVLLLDSRLQPQVLDLELSRYIRALNHELVPVLTKADKCGQKQLADIRRTWSHILGQDESPVAFSSKTGLGRDKLWEKIIKAAGD